MKSLPTIGKFLFAIPFLIFGFGHFGNAGAMSGLVPAYLPGAVFWVYITGVALVLASISLLINKKAKLAMTLLGIMLVLFALMIHLPLLMGGDQMAFPSFLKDLSLAGAAFWISGQVKN